MQLYYQGQLDFFCALYAVINALTAMFGLNLAQARGLLASTLEETSRHPDLWRATLENKTDFYWLTSYMLAGCHRGSPWPLFVYRPFAPSGPEELPESARDLSAAALRHPEAEKARFADGKEEQAVWSALEAWLPSLPEAPVAGAARRVALLRFHRYVPYMKEPIISHWSVGERFYGGTVHLRDASKEESALRALAGTQTAVHENGLGSNKNVLLEAESLFFLERL